MAPRAPDARQLSDLLELSQTLGATLNLRQALQRVLAILEESRGTLSGTIVLRDEPASDLVVEAASGAGGSVRSARYRLGEGIVGRVAQSGRTVVVPQVSQEPLFLDRSGVFRRSGRSEMTYVCVPIRAEHRTVGALGVALAFQKDRSYDHEAKFYGLVGSMIGQAVRVHHLVEAERKRLLDENTKLRRELTERYDIRNLVGSSRPMQTVYEQVAQVAPANTTVLLRGESGTGKELVAHAIHYSSPRAKKPFVKVSCAALPESLIETELFGYEPGAFTDARTEKKGRFELAQRRHDLPRRDRRAGPGHPGQAAARAAGARDRAARRRPADQAQRAGDRRHQQGPRGGGQGGHLPRGPLLPAERVLDLPAAAARAQDRHPAARRPLRGEARRGRTPRTCAASPPPRSTC